MQVKLYFLYLLIHFYDFIMVITFLCFHYDCSSLITEKDHLNS